MMKKTILVSLAALAVTSASAQSVNDALLMSENDYFGTARTMAMGNAFTALGGDLGSIGINPAGSAVSRHSQFTLTPNLSIAATGAGFSADPLNEGYGMASDNTRTRMTMPNYGINMYMSLGKRLGLKGISLGFVGNATANYLERITAFGDNPYTSFMGEMADGLAYDRVPFTTFSDNFSQNYDNAQLSWREALGWNTGMFYHPDGTEPYDYQASTEVEPYVLGGPLTQSWGRQNRGYKHDMVFNLGMNFSDMFYLGFNIGLVALEMSRDTYLKEEARNPADFPNDFGVDRAFFTSAALRDYLSVEGSGLYGKVGFIFVPTPAFRIGAAVQTPTSMHVHEFYQTAGECNFSSTRFSASDRTPKGEGEYYLTSPLRFNAGTAVNFGVGVISVDYEMADYGTMRFRSAYDDFGTDYYNFAAENEDIHNAYGMVHALRVGFEIKPVPEIAVRAGYNYSTVADKEHDPGISRQTASIGLGYSSGGSFFCDFALRGSFRPTEYYQLYNDYFYDENDFLVIASPRVKIDSRLFDLAVTFGWRF